MAEQTTAKPMTRKQAKRKGLISDEPRHVYFYRHEVRAGGRVKRFKITPGALVKQPKQPVEIMVLTEHAQYALDHNGCGNANRCTLANAIAANEAEFPHKVTGTVMVGRSVIYVVATEDKHGRPKTAYRYYCPQLRRHNIDVTNDDSKGGLQRLVKQLSDEGPVILKLSPRTRDGEIWTSKGGTGKYTGTRTATHSQGAKRRYIDSVSGFGSTPVQPE